MLEKLGRGVTLRGIGWSEDCCRKADKFEGARHGMEICEMDVLASLTVKGFDAVFIL